MTARTIARILVFVALLLSATLAISPNVFAQDQDKKTTKKKKEKPPSALDKYIKEASVPQASNGQVAENGSVWAPAARYSNLAADLRARNVDDIVTVLVSESASAVSTGASKTQRQTSAQSSITALAGPTNPVGPLANLANFGSNTQLNGQGSTSRQTTLTTTLTARVTHVLVNGNLVIEGTRNLNVNSENQIITVRGVIRPEDLDTTNSVASSRLAQMEIQVDGKGIVNDAIRRPNFLYRLLLNLLPF
jgi:flagellar L-ring protein precursor FlgH